MSTRILVGDVTERLRELPDESVHCAITSPPYWGLRDYGVEGMIGLEATPEEWCARLVEVFREVRRVLRGDGTLFLNLGDSYNAQQGAGYPGFGGRNVASDDGVKPKRPPGYKTKDLIGQPWLLAFALRADGWYLRSEIIWAKGVSFCPTYSGSVMPESVTDRPTKGHETVFLLAKAAGYFYDAEAVRETGAEPGRQRDDRISGANGHTVRHSPGGMMQASASRNLRDVWTINPQPLPEAHFASYPRALVRPCIQAGTSERGVCGECGAPWERVVEKSGGTTGASWHNHTEDDHRGTSQGGRASANGYESTYRRRDLGWRPTCPHEDAPTVPGTVLDPFLGSGTTALVARELGRDCIGVELNPDYAAMAERRLFTDGKGTPDMFADVTMEPTPCTD